MDEAEIDAQVEVIRQLSLTATEVLAGHARRPPQEPLYQYTDTTGLLGMLKDRCIWATHHDFLNDHNELKHLSPHAFKFLRQEGIPDEWIVQLSNTFLLGCDIYIACFSIHSDLLSQWRGYAADGRGFAVGFSKKLLPRTVVLDNGKRRRTATLHRVIYDSVEQHHLLETMLRPLIEHSKSLGTNIPQQLALAFIRALDMCTSLLNTRCKSPGFKEEDEWRLVSLRHHDDTRMKPKFRTGKYGLTPYIELKREDDQQLAISDLVLGPCHNAPSLHAAKMLMESYDLEVVPRPSSTTYR